VGVTDGDTIEVLVERRADRVRLHGIDCPERGQPFGNRASQFTAERAFRKRIILKVRDMDRYGRLVGHRPKQQEFVLLGESNPWALTDRVADALELGQERVVAVALGQHQSFVREPARLDFMTAFAAHGQSLVRERYR
jgi:hypothetical protein